MYKYNEFLIEEQQANERLIDIFIYNKNGNYISRMTLIKNDYKKHLYHFLNETINNYKKYKKTDIYLIKM